MGIVDGMARTVVREGMRAATAPKPPQQPPGWQPQTAGRHPGTVAVTEGRVIQPGTPRPKARPIDGALLWCYVRRYLSHYVAFRTEEELDRVTAWVFHASARKRGELGMGPLIWNASPRLLIKSRKRGAGKSTLLRLIGILTASHKAPRITAARFAQITGQKYETVCIDEGKIVFGCGAAHLDLQGCVLDGYAPGSFYEVSKTSLPLFGAVAIAAKEALITEAAKAVDGDESSIGDILDRCLTATLAAPDIPPPEVGQRAEAEGGLLCRALIAWTGQCREALEEAAQDIADEDYQAACARAARGGKAAETPRALQIGRPLRAIGRVIDQQVIAEARARNAADPDPDYADPEPQCEAEILACLGTQAEDIMAELEALSGGWGEAQFTGEDGAVSAVTEGTQR